MSKKIGFWIDPLDQLNPKKDSTLQIIKALQVARHRVYIFNTHHIFLGDKQVRIRATAINIDFNQQSFYQITKPPKNYHVSYFDTLFIRKDPPFDANYLYACQLLAACEKDIPIYNQPSTLCQLNEKSMTQYFPALIPDQLISASEKDITLFAKRYEKIVIKPLDGMGGKNVFITEFFDPNFKIIINNLSANQTQLVVAQVYLPEIEQGDKRILMIDGKPVEHVLVRQPQGKWGRGNLAMGAQPIVRPLAQKERIICDQLQCFFQTHGLFFVGLDMIGNYITEINITSPTGICEINNHIQQNVADLLVQAIC